MNAIIFWISFLVFGVSALAISINELNIFNRLADITTFDKSLMTSLPNGFVLSTIPRGTKLNHFRLPDYERENPIWFCIDIEFCQLVLPLNSTIIDQTFLVTEDIKNVLVIDGRSTLLSESFDFLVFGKRLRYGFGDDELRIQGLCEKFPSIGGF